VKVIGLTGRIGCGKSTVAGLLHQQGVVALDADWIARDTRETDPQVRAGIMARFGTLEPAALAGSVFDDPAALADLEAIVHPAVRDRVRDRLAALELAGTAVVSVEAIKLLESPLRERCDQVWVVICRPQEAVRRLAARGMSGAEAERRMANQAAEEDLVGAADVVIDGSADLAEVRRQVDRALAELVGSPESSTSSETDALGG
jgi:dephospho-CoA kinase